MNNLIPCIKKCMYQKDGYCNLDEIMVINALNIDVDCLYFTPIVSKNSKSKANK
ncbi:MAG: hypothetical protein RR710_06275 [Oscillospiraceae bacterium]